MVVTAAAASASEGDGFVTSTGAELGLSTLKQAHDRDGIVLRVYEPHGSRGRASLRFAEQPASVTRVTLLEEPAEGGEITLDGSTASFEIGPFEIVTLLIER
jgi:alpha-mannosidase